MAERISKAVSLKRKIDRLMNMDNKSFAFRLAAITASDCRPGIVWP